MREFIRLQLKLKWGLNRNNSKSSAVMTGIAALFAVGIGLALVWALSVALRRGVNVSVKQLSQLYLTILMLGLTVVATGMQMKRLYRPADLLITARFPLSPFKMFLSYLILNYIDLCIYSAAVLLPVMVIFGVAAGCFTFVYFLGVLLGVLLMPLIPFALSVFLAIPAVYLSALLERHGVVRLIVFVVFLVGAFFLYDYLLNLLAQYFIHKNWQANTLEIWEAVLHGVDGYYNPAYYLGNVIFFERFWLGFGVLLGAGAILLAGGVALARAVCTSFRSKALDSGIGLYARPSSVDGLGSAGAIFRYSFREILRTKTYSYFYLGVAISTPVMVFFCNDLVTKVGEAQMGAGINFGASMLVIAVFMAMICSFTGTVLSVEGKNFYITKLIPVPFRDQLLVKALLNILVSSVALAISITVIGVLQFVDLAEIAVLASVQLALAAGLVFNGINLNLANPNLKPKANGEPEEINITYMLLIGLAIAAILGTCCIILPKFSVLGRTAAYIIAAVLTFAYAFINIMIFWFTANRKYRKIEA